ncbi:MAG TPA: acetyl-CoA hydrolase/transferase C-terminal domain-containing protein [Candidatus Binataceae bacterium]
MRRRPHEGFDWRALLGPRLVTAEEAVSHVDSGDRVSVSLALQTPHALCGALAARLSDLERVVISHSAALFDWDIPGVAERFRLQSTFLSPVDRHLHDTRREEFMPVGLYRAGVLPPGLDNFNVFMVRVSPPNRDGYVSFGESLIMSKLMARRAELVIGEIDERAIWTGGDNAIHLSEINFFVEPIEIVPRAQLPPPSEEEQRTVGAICELVARELVPDRATIQVGVGSTSGMLMYALGRHHDLGMATEVIPRGTVPLVREGIVTGKFKKLMPGVVTASAFSPVTPEEEVDLADGDARFHLYDFNFTDDVRVIAREEGLIAVNNAIAVDFGGQAASESIGTRMFSGTGGQTVFAIGACLAGGLSIIVLPSSSMVKGRRVSRIVPVLEPGSVVTSTRSSVHYIVTEHGIADLRGKSVPERARELIAIAHPDFRAELNEEAHRLYG